MPPQSKNMKSSSTPKTPPSTPLQEGSHDAARQDVMQLMALLKDPKVLQIEHIQQLMGCLKIVEKKSQTAELSFKEVNEMYVLLQVDCDQADIAKLGFKDVPI
jgi:hypothetical protein